MVQGELTQRSDEPGLQDLLDSSLIVRNIFETDLYLVADPFQVWRYHVNRERQGLAESLARMEAIEALFATLPARVESGESGVSFLASKDDANAEIIKALERARFRVFTSHHMVRPKKAMEDSLPRDLELIERGLALRTIFVAESRGRDGEAMWATEVTRRGAEVRTLQGNFRRMVLIDDAFVVLGDYTRPASAKTGWKVEHDGMLAFAAAVFEDQWRRAEPWMGGELGEAPTETVTTPMTRSILSGLSRGRTQASIANELGVSTRTLTNHLTRLYEQLGFEPGDQFRLGRWWATSEERHLG
ncbi:LuxR C-terminal-related transcriptional regulator [Streptomyces sp. NPDC056374]|uniref:LuxR C-terminal-related transcriptional regulator n=1 Tax=unclassified Streptomyces TaxID=2593676 RepID=UPI0035D7E9AC